jgi:hypothetical protein
LEIDNAVKVDRPETSRVAKLLFANIKACKDEQPTTSTFVIELELAPNTSNEGQRATSIYPKSFEDAVIYSNDEQLSAINSTNDPICKFIDEKLVSEIFKTIGGLPETTISSPQSLRDVQPVQFRFERLCEHSIVVSAVQLETSREVILQFEILISVNKAFPASDNVAEAVDPFRLNDPKLLLSKAIEVRSSQDAKLDTVVSELFSKAIVCRAVQSLKSTVVRLLLRASRLNRAGHVLIPKFTKTLLNSVKDVNVGLFNILKFAKCLKFEISTVVRLLYDR